MFQITIYNICVSTDILQSQHVSRNAQLHDMQLRIVCRLLDTRVGQYSIVCLYGKDKGLYCERAYMVRIPIPEMCLYGEDA